jgi:hypothetical protein
MHDARCAALRAELRALASDQARVVAERVAIIAPKVNYRIYNNIANNSSIMHCHQHTHNKADISSIMNCHQHTHNKLFSVRIPLPAILFDHASRKSMKPRSQLSTIFTDTLILREYHLIITSSVALPSACERRTRRGGRLRRASERTICSA